MSPCQIFSILTTLTAAGGLGLVILGPIGIVNFLIAGSGGRLEPKNGRMT